MLWRLDQLERDVHRQAFVVRLVDDAERARADYIDDAEAVPRSAGAARRRAGAGGAGSSAIRGGRARCAPGAGVRRAPPRRPRACVDSSSQFTRCPRRSSRRWPPAMGRQRRSSRDISLARRTSARLTAICAAPGLFLSSTSAASAQLSPISTRATMASRSEGFNRSSASSYRSSSSWPIACSSGDGSGDSWSVSSSSGGALLQPTNLRPDLIQERLPHVGLERALVSGLEPVDVSGTWAIVSCARSCVSVATAPTPADGHAPSARAGAGNGRTGRSGPRHRPGGRAVPSVIVVSGPGGGLRAKERRRDPGSPALIGGRMSSNSDAEVPIIRRLSPSHCRRLSNAPTHSLHTPRPAKSSPRREQKL